MIETPTTAAAEPVRHYVIESEGVPLPLPHPIPTRWPYIIVRCVANGFVVLPTYARYPDDEKVYVYATPASLADAVGTWAAAAKSPIGSV